MRAFDLQGVSLWRWHAATASRVPILEGVEWTARAGERWALLGPNGAGKTTLLTVLAAVEFPSLGAAELLGRRLGRTDVFRLREEIGFVDARLGHRFPTPFSVEQVVETGATGTVGWFPARIDEATCRRAAELLELFDCRRIARRRFADCSQGERKRTLIARALVSRPRLLLLDEPGAGLDLPGRETLLAALGRLADDEPELTVVATTHHLEELPASTTHAVLLRAGRVVAAGPAARTLTSELLSACFGLPVQVNRANGRWSATAL